MVKFALIAIMSIIVVCQDFIIYWFLSMFPPKDAPGELSESEQMRLSVHISSFFSSLEMVFLLVLVTKHFRIRTDEAGQDDEDAYDEMHGTTSLNNLHHKH